MHNGKIKNYDPLKGFGFITREKGREVFFHWTDIISKHEGASAYPGLSISFELDNTKKNRARKVSIVGAE